MTRLRGGGQVPCLLEGPGQNPHRLTPACSFLGPEALRSGAAGPSGLQGSRGGGRRPGPEGRLRNVGAGRSSQVTEPGHLLTFGKRGSELALWKSAWGSGSSAWPPCPGTRAFPPPQGGQGSGLPGSKPLGKYSETMQPPTLDPLSSHHSLAPWRPGERASVQS